MKDIDDPPNNLLNGIEDILTYLEQLHYPPLVTHEEAVSRYMYSFARILNLSEQEAITLSFAGKFHDVGKLRIPLSILNKAGPLDASQRSKIQRHSEIGSHILEIIDYPVAHVAALVAHFHHENFDGSGYPNGLKGEEIPFESRLCSICDVYDVLRSRGCYKKRFSHQEAVDLMTSKTNGGLFYKFDPDLLKEFERNHHIFEQITLQPA
jgi:putative two-component system response regulator